MSNNLQAIIINQVYAWKEKKNDTGKQIQLITYNLNNPVWYIQAWIERV